MAHNVWNGKQLHFQSPEILMRKCYLLTYRSKAQPRCKLSKALDNYALLFSGHLGLGGENHDCKFAPSPCPVFVSIVEHLDSVHAKKV